MNAKPRRQVYFKKAEVKSEENFRVDGSDDEFVILSNIISRHFTRINGDSLILAETASWFTYAGLEKSLELFETYNNVLGNIPLSDITAVNSEDGDKLPTYILCKNGDVLKIRSKQSILMYPNARSEFDLMYSRLLLFYPLRSEDELLESDMKEMYSQMGPSEDGTIIDLNERNLFKKKIQLQNPILDDLEESDEAEDALDHLLEVLDDVGDGNEENEEAEDALSHLLEALEEAHS